MQTITGEIIIKHRTIVFAGASDTGRRRRNNEDNFTIIPKANLFCVLDGVGGLEGGEIASQCAVDSICELSRKDSKDDVSFWQKFCSPFYNKKDVTVKHINQLMKYVNKSVFYLAKSIGKQMATTIVMIKIVKMRMYVSHVGDSRAYLLRNNILGQVTLDHNLATGLLIAGTPLSKNQSCLYQHTITRAIGSHSDVNVETQELYWEAGDIFILCTDGLTDMVDDNDLCEIIITNQAHPQHIVENLIQQANDVGGKDNITVIALKVA